MNELLTSLRLWLGTLVVCCVVYPGALWLIGQAVTPGTAEGSLIRTSEGTVVGSELIAQDFTQPRYFWPRPSAAGYDASATGGSNLSPTNPDLAGRAREIIGRLDLPADARVPAELVTASGSGMDPHITEAGARVQVARVAGARGLSEDEVGALVDEAAFYPSGIPSGVRVVNVLELNLALDGASR